MHLILTDGCSLNVGGGINGNEDSALSIYAQSTGDLMGSLTVTGGGQTEGVSAGIFVNGNFTLNGDNVTSTSGTADTESNGIRANSAIKISGGSVTATGGAVTASGDSTQITSEGIVVIRGDITITGGSVTATGGAATGGERATSHGIYAIGESEISACNITITGDAQVTATAGAAVAESCGIAAICIVTGNYGNFLLIKISKPVRSSVKRQK